jgi:hypothetical protein
MAHLGLDPALCHLEANGIICVKGASPKVKRVVDFSFVPVELVSDVSVEKRGVVSDKLTVLPVPKDLLKGAVVGGVNGGLNAASDDFAYTLHVEWMPDTGMDKLNPGDVGKVGKVGNVGNVGKVGNVGAVH